MNSQLQALSQWAQLQLNDPGITLQSLYGDASHRRYYRIQKSSNSLIIVDASAELAEIPVFIGVAKILQQKGLSVPHIYAMDIERGFLLLSDFGDQTLLQQLTGQNVDYYYQQAFDHLLCMQKHDNIEYANLADYDEVLIVREWETFTDWFLQAYKNVDLNAHRAVLTHTLQLLLTIMQTQPQIFIHRDYHSRNLMILPDKQLGILDFQGARRGPITYDLVSVLKDCYIDWPQQRVKHWALSMQTRIWRQANLSSIDTAQFLRYFDLTGLQRHLKVLGQFARKAIAEQDDSYLVDMPRVKKYVLDVCQTYDELYAFKQFLLEIKF